MICPGCGQSALTLFQTREGHRCRACKDKLPEPPPIEKKSVPRGYSKAGRSKVIKIVEEQLWEEIRQAMKDDPKLKNSFNRGQVLAYQKAISFLSKYKTVNLKNHEA